MKLIALIGLLIATPAVAGGTTDSIQLNLGPPSWALYDGTLGTEPVVTIRADGSVTLRKDVNLDEASKAFWDQLERMGMKLACPQPASLPPEWTLPGQH